MTLSELISKHGIPVSVRCITGGVAPFRIVKCIGNNEARIVYYGDEIEHTVRLGPEPLDDYELDSVRNQELGCVHGVAKDVGLSNATSCFIYWCPRCGAHGEAKVGDDFILWTLPDKRE